MYFPVHRCTGVRISLAPVKLHSSNIVAVSDRHDHLLSELLVVPN